MLSNLGYYSLLVLNLYVFLNCLCAVDCFRRLVVDDDTNFANLSSIPLQPAEYTFDTIRRQLGDVSSESHLVQNLPGLSEHIKQYAGHITIDTAKNSNIFYWLFEPEKNSDSLPLLIWLNGGPGCSSMDGLWLELGPLRLDATGSTISINRASWHNAANILFVDQPVGTGFAYTKSKSGYATNDDMINSQFYVFLTHFFALHPRYVRTEADGKVTKTRPFFMSGESHAGHYIPTIAKHILDRNEEARSSGRGDLVVDLQGIALGNPWIDPFHQYDASDFAHGLGIINQGQKHRLKELEKKCQGILKSGKFNNPACFSLLDKIVESTAVGGTDRVLMYDARKYVRQTSSFPPGHETLERYLNRADVKQAIHAMGTPNKFEECSNPPFYALSHQDGKGVTKELVSILDRDVRVLIFAGQFDLICNHMGIEKVLRGLAWKNQRDWLMAAPAVWHVDGKPAGFVRAHNNLEFLIVLDAGHMVPMDQPKVGLAMIQSFLQDRRFGKAPSKLGVSLAGPHDDNSISLQCPRFLESSNSSASKSGSVASESDSLMSKLSHWAGGKKKAGNLRKNKGVHSQGAPGSSRRAHAAQVDKKLRRQLTTQEVNTPMEHDAHPNFCSSIRSADGSCCTSLEMKLQLPNSGTWAAPGRVQGSSRELAAAVLRADIDDAVQGVFPPVERAMRLSVQFDRMERNAQNVVVLDESFEEDAQGVFVTVQVCGRADFVHSTTAALAAQVKNESSQLRAGLLSRYLSAQHSVIVAHHDVSTQVSLVEIAVEYLLSWFNFCWPCLL